MTLAMNSNHLFFESLKRSLLNQDKGGNPYDLGFDCGKNGPNTTNCSFLIFSSKERTRAWERGKAAGERARKAPSAQTRFKKQGAAPRKQRT